MSFSTEDLVWALSNGVPQAVQGCSLADVKYTLDLVTEFQAKGYQVGAHDHVYERWIQKVDVTSVHALIAHRGDRGIGAVKGVRASCNFVRTGNKSIVEVLIDFEVRTDKALARSQSKNQIDLIWTCWCQDALKSLIRKEAVVVSGDGQQWLM
jgi:hypothetical protein